MCIRDRCIGQARSRQLGFGQRADRQNIRFPKQSGDLSERHVVRGVWHKTTPPQYGCLIESLSRRKNCTEETAQYANRLVYPSIFQIFTKNLVKAALQNPVHRINPIPDVGARHAAMIIEVTSDDD